MSTVLFLSLLFLAGLCSFLFNRNYLLLMLLSLEFMVIVIFFSMVLFLTLYSYEYYLILVFLTFSVCEGALGLAMMVSLIRVHGNDYISSAASSW